MPRSDRIVRGGIYGLIFFYIYLWWFALTNKDPKVHITTLDFSHIPLMNAKFKERGLPPYCYPDIEKLGLVDVNFHEKPSLESVEEANSDVAPGGTWKPSGCQAQQKVAIVVPYRDRWHHLKLLLKRLHPMLRRQMVEYRIFVVEQMSPLQFNRAMLMNVGFAEAMKLDKYDCVIFHDVDLLPENDKNLYLCDDNLRHLAGAIDEMRYHVVYYNYVGGVSALSRDNFYKVNGFSNLYWGWGQEDDDFCVRNREAGLAITRPPRDIARFKMVRHVKAEKGDSVSDMFMSWHTRWRTDGINSLDKTGYSASVKAEKLYTNISADLGEIPDSSTIDMSEHVGLYWFLKYYGYLP